MTLSLFVIPLPLFSVSDTIFALVQLCKNRALPNHDIINVRSLILFWNLGWKSIRVKKSASHGRIRWQRTAAIHHES